MAKKPPTKDVPPAHPVDGPLDEEDKNMLNVIANTKKNAEGEQSKSAAQAKAETKQQALEQVREADDFYRRETQKFNENYNEFIGARQAVLGTVAAIMAYGARFFILKDEIEQSQAQIAEDTETLQLLELRLQSIGGRQFITNNLMAMQQIQQEFMQIKRVYDEKKAKIVTDKSNLEAAKLSNNLMPAGFPQAKRKYDEIQPQLDDLQTKYNDAMSKFDAAIASKTELQRKVDNLQDDIDTSTLLTDAQKAAIRREIKEKTDEIKKVDVQIPEKQSVAAQILAQIRAMENDNLIIISEYKRLKKQYDDAIVEQEEKEKQINADYAIVVEMDDIIPRISNIITSTMRTLNNMESNLKMLESSIYSHQVRMSNNMREIITSFGIFTTYDWMAPDAKAIEKVYREFDAKYPTLSSLRSNFFKKKTECYLLAISM